MNFIDSWVDEFFQERLQAVSHAFGIVKTVMIVCFSVAIGLALALVAGAWRRFRGDLGDYQRRLAVDEVIHTFEVANLLEERLGRFLGRTPKPRPAPLPSKPRRAWRRRGWWALAVLGVVVFLSTAIYFVIEVCL